jgi:hypothetical protein
LALGGFSPSDIKEMTTGISMTFKGQYGVYAPPVFANKNRLVEQAKDVFEGTVVDDDPIPMKHPTDKDQSTEKIATWEDTIHPKSGKKLSDLDKVAQRKLAAWMLCTDPDTLDPEPKRFFAAVAMMAGAKSLTPQSVLRGMLADRPEVADGSLLPDAVAAICMERFGAAPKDLSDDDAIQCIQGVDSLVKAAVSLGKRKAEPAADDDDNPY